MSDEHREQSDEFMSDPASLAFRKMRIRDEDTFIQCARDIAKLLTGETEASFKAIEACREKLLRMHQIAHAYAEAILDDKMSEVSLAVVRRIHNKQIQPVLDKAMTDYRTVNSWVRSVDAWKEVRPARVEPSAATAD